MGHTIHQPQYSKYSKIGKIVQLYGCHGNKNAFCQHFSCGPDRALQDGHFGALHDHAGRSRPEHLVWEPENTQK